MSTFIFQQDGIGSVVKKEYKRKLLRNRRKWNKVDCFVSPKQYEQLQNIKRSYQCALNQLCSNACRRYIWTNIDFSPVEVSNDWKRVNLVFTQSEMNQLIDLCNIYGTSKRGMATRIIQHALPFDFEEEDFYTCKEDILLMERERKENENVD